METIKPKTKKNKIIFRIIICILIIFLGLTGRTILAGLKKPPAEAKTEEPSIKVETLTIEKKDYPILITGYGEVQALNVVFIAPEVSGKIIEIHPRLEIGEIIPKGDILFKIDSQDYQTAVRTGRERLKVLTRNRDLAKKEYQRVSRLFKENNVGTQSGVDMAEKAMLSADDIFLQLKQALEIAETNLERCTIRTQFTGRVRQVSLEKGQFVAPGQNVLTLVDDSILEIHVPIDSRDARQWLQFDENNQNYDQKIWFSGLTKIPCLIQWTEDEKDRTWEGFPHRIVKFDQKTRTITIAIRINSEQANHSNKNGLPLVEGMFCKINIPGKTLTNVFRLPRWSVSFKNTIYLAVANRLKTVSVKVERAEGEYIYVSEGIEQGDSVITTRLIDPLENSLLKITNQ